MCGDSVDDLNYPEIPDSWNNKEKTKMANFSKNVNCGIGYIQNSKEFLIYRRGSIVPFFRIPAEVFEHFFGLNENFPEQDKKVFRKTEDAKHVQKEIDYANCKNH